MLAELERQPGTRTDRTSDHDGPRLFRDEIDALHIAPTTAKRWQEVAAAPESVFNAYLNEDHELTTAGLLRGRDRPGGMVKRYRPLHEGGAPQIRIRGFVACSGL